MANVSILIANVATHPDHRRKGIARTLTEQVMQHARQRGVDALWLHVRADNPGAVQMYSDLGFVERAQPDNLAYEKANSSALLTTFSACRPLPSDIPAIGRNSLPGSTSCTLKN